MRYYKLFVIYAYAFKILVKLSYAFSSYLRMNLSTTQRSKWARINQTMLHNVTLLNFLVASVSAITTNL